MPTLYLSTTSNSVHLENDAFIIHSRGNEINPQENYSRILARDVNRIVVAGTPNISIPVIKHACRKGIPLSLVSTRNGWIGEFCGNDTMRDASRRMAQYYVADNENLAILAARELIIAKIYNQRFVLRRLAARNASPNCIRALAILKNLQKNVEQANTITIIRGKEGAAAALYFSALAEFFPETIQFNGRSRRPPRDPANALLSFAYAIIRGEIESAIRVHGLDAYLGCLHTNNHNKPSLSLDLIEPLRPSVDAFVLSLFNKRIFDEKDFSICEENNGTYLAENSQAKFFKHYEQNICRKFFFKPTGTSLSLRDIIDWQIYRYIEFLKTVKTQPAAPKFFHIQQ